jgi:hypothetical protein
MAEDDDDVWESDKDERSEEEIVRGGGARSTSELDREWQARQAQFHTVSSLSLSQTSSQSRFRFRCKSLLILFLVLSALLDSVSVAISS